MTDGPTFGLRRVMELGPDEPLPASEPALLARILAEIDDRGPMTFARFMELALYDPDHGYYSGTTDRPGRSGDFLTAPEGHPIFGWAIARQVEEVWDRLGRPDRFAIREHGAGTGALAVGLLDGLQRAGSPLATIVRYQPVEVSNVRRTAIDQRLADADLAWHREAADTTPVTGVVIANELLDALPVHRVIGGPDGRIRELFVDRGADGSLVERAGEPSTPALQARLNAEGIVLRPGRRGEICLALDQWITEAARGLGRGLLLLIDYGYPANELYDNERRPDGTLLAYLRHRVQADPFRHVGHQDLTAHVDLTAVERAATTAGLVPVGATSQAEFLAGLGAGDLLVGFQGDPSTTLADYLEARAALVRMLDPAVTGGFRVLGFGRDMPATPSLAGFTIRLARPTRERG